MSRGIELSPKHGVNATIPCCFWCGRQKNEIALLGRVRKYEDTHTAYGTKSRRVVDNDAEAPITGLVLDYEPCDECHKIQSTGVHCIEVTAFQPEDKRPAISKDGDTLYYPTGRNVIITTEAAERAFNGVDTKAGSKLSMPQEVFEGMFGEAIRQL